MCSILDFFFNHCIEVVLLLLIITGFVFFFSYVMLEVAKRNGELWTVYAVEDGGD